MGVRYIMFKEYSEKLQQVLQTTDWTPVELLADKMLDCWVNNRSVYLCGNGGSAGNAIHLANDFLYGIANETGKGLKVHALPANSAVITCLGNDLGYDSIFSEQVAVYCEESDLLIVLSGSGNSPNVLRALEQAKAKGVTTCALLGFSGGQAKDIADIVIHIPVDDMQIAEDLQIIIGHMLMKWLKSKKEGRA